ncbi:PP2C family serine/threonine-protein phosphatase [Entomohabitans teleogrylli]|uniref:PP2C family serine/threonine-protein phosphatase n=1 Tax=Entomohabitans teleogrylli TaxID=1384589 RepID=UPI00073D37F1|nr:PP2C family serine/threonine-protein phosphatase [Entomohabitans teleogrylli]
MWRIYGASAVGWSHQQHQLPCQDAFYAVSDGERMIAAVCDGAGSARFSHDGATFVTRQIVARLLLMGDRTLTEQALRGEIEQVRLDLSLLAAEYGHDVEEYACTLLVVWVDASQGWIMHLGDGSALMQGAREDERVFSAAENGEYANQTWFLTSESWREHLRIQRVAFPVQQLVMMTDGVQPFALDKGGEGLFAPFMTPVIDYLRRQSVQEGSAALRATLDDPRTQAITGDDKTLLIALRGAL